ncbi:WbqC family protein [Myroides sp. LJL119]
MDSILVQPCYFGSISTYVAMMQSDKIYFETNDNFQKQTNRNRMYIYSANATQMLTIPIKHTGQSRLFKDAVIEQAFGWQKQHFKSLEAAYRTSPFFEYFEDDIRAVFEKHYKYMLDLNLDTHQIVCDSLGINLDYEKTLEFQKQPNPELLDLRYLADGKKDPNEFEPYTQVFDQKHGFINNLSILDLLFNESRQAVDYLKNQKLIIK